MVDFPQTTSVLQVTVKSPLALVYTGKVKALTLFNESGKFDILPLHSNFITIIKDTIVIYETIDKKKEIKIEQGIAKVFENTVDIFIGLQTIS